MRLGYLDAHLTRRDHPLAEFSGGDAAVVEVLYWARHIRMDGPYPAIGSYYQRQLTRPCIARAAADEMKLFGENAAV
jgi:glutathione S-transferase